jgi:hypothetical protein
MSAAAMRTTEGVIVFELFDDAAPETVATFRKLASECFYHGLTFHRLIKDFMIQGGCPTGTTGGTGSTATTDPTFLTFAKDAAQTYDPLKRAGAEFGPAANAIDDKPNTVWDVVVPADGQPIGAGLVIDLGKPYALRSLRLSTPTDGFTVEVYGAKSAKELPADVIDKRWIHLTDSKATLDDDLILLKGKGDGAKVQLVLLYFTLPGDPTDPKVAIGDVKLRGTP